jgi:hypothetical protein
MEIDPRQLCKRCAAKVRKAHADYMRSYRRKKKLEIEKEREDIDNFWDQHFSDERSQIKH